MSVADQIKKAVTRMPPGVRLDTVMKLVGMGLEADERLQDVVVEGWQLVVKEEWWKARYETFSEFEALSGMADGVAELIRIRKRTAERK